MTEAQIITNSFNELEIPDRKAYLEYLLGQSQEEYDKFIKIIRDQAVDDFWYNELYQYETCRALFCIWGTF